MGSVRAPVGPQLARWRSAPPGLRLIVHKATRAPTRAQRARWAGAPYGIRLVVGKRQPIRKAPSAETFTNPAALARLLRTASANLREETHHALISAMARNTGLSASQVQDLVAQVAQTVWGKQASHITTSLREEAARSGEGAFHEVRPGVLTQQLGIRFDYVNPRATLWAQEHAGLLITQLTDTVAATVQSIVTRAVATGMGPRDLASLLSQVVYLHDRYAGAVMNYRIGLETQGTLPGTRIDELVAAYHDQLLDTRAETIARTELLTAMNEGKLEAFTQAQEAGLLTATAQKVWITGEDERVCSPDNPKSSKDGPWCEPMDGVQVPLDEPFVLDDGSSIDTPPLHPLCRCTLEIIDDVPGLESGDLSAATEEVWTEALFGDVAARYVEKGEAEGHWRLRADEKPPA